MSFWNEAFFFERRGDRYIYRSNVFAPGYTVSKAEKDRLFSELARLQWQLVAEGGVFLAAIFAVLSFVAFDGLTRTLWLVAAVTTVLAVEAGSYFYRRDKAVARILNRRKPDLPPLPLRRALTKPRPLVSKRIAAPVVRIVAALIGLTVLIVDVFSFYIVLAAYQIRDNGAEADKAARAAELIKLTVDNPSFWLLVMLFNGFLIGIAFFLMRSVRRLRAMPEVP